MSLHLPNVIGVFNANLGPGLPNWNHIPSLPGTLQLSAIEFLVTGTIRSAATFTWASDNPAVATVSSSGLVTGVGSGICHITATSDDQNGGSLPIGVALLSLGSGGSIAFGSSTTCTCTGGTNFNTSWFTGCPGCTSLIGAAADPLSLGRVVGGQITIKAVPGMTLSGATATAHIPIVCSFQTGDSTINNALQGNVLPTLFGGIYAVTTLTVTNVPGWQGA